MTMDHVRSDRITRFCRPSECGTGKKTICKEGVNTVLDRQRFSSLSAQVAGFRPSLGLKPDALPSELAQVPIIRAWCKRTRNLTSDPEASLCKYQLAQHAESRKDVETPTK